MLSDTKSGGGGVAVHFRPNTKSTGGGVAVHVRPNTKSTGGGGGGGRESTGGT